MTDEIHKEEGFPEESDFDFVPPSRDDILAEKIVTYYGFFEEYYLKKIAKTCAKLMISEYFRDLCYDTFKVPEFEEMKEWVVEEMRRDFEEKVVPLIEKTYPDLDEDEFDAKVSELERMYEKEHNDQLLSTTKAALKELKTRVNALKKDLITIKHKYTV